MNLTQTQQRILKLSNIELNESNYLLGKKVKIKSIKNRIEKWWKDGAYIGSDGRREYYKNGKLHRLDGPAIIRPDGIKEYYKNGKRHRLDGPAIIRPNGRKEYWIEGKEIKTN